MRYLFILSLIFLSLQAQTKSEMFQLYQNEKFEEACQIGTTLFTQNRSDEEFLSLYGFSCLYADYIDRLALPMSLLKSTPEARANAAYFSVIIMQKKLLMHALQDNYQIHSVQLPTTDYVLSKVFNLYQNDTNTNKRQVYIYSDPLNKKITYRLYISAKSSLKKMIIEEYYDKIMAKRHIYW